MDEVIRHWSEGETVFMRFHVRQNDKKVDTTDGKTGGKADGKDGNKVAASG